MTGQPLSPRLLLAALLLPLLGLAGGALHAWWQTSHGSVWEVPIRGYDPRDLLRGHYIRFQYDWPTTGPTTRAAPAQWRVCFRHTGQTVAIEALALTPLPADCRAVARQLAGHDGLLLDYQGHGRGQFYLDEAEARPLERLLADPDHKLSVRVIITASGRMTPLDILVDGRPYRQVLAAMTETPAARP